MSLEHSPFRQRGPGRPRKDDTPRAPPEPQVFLTQDQLAARWHVTPQTISRNGRKLGLRPTVVMGRNLYGLAHIEGIERQRTAGGDDQMA